MADYYLKAADEAAMNAALVAAGLAYVEDDTLVPAPYVFLDVIGPIVKTVTPVIGYSYEGVIYENKIDIPHTTEWDEELGEELPVYPDGVEAIYGDPITVEYPEWHVNLRCAGLTEEQEAELAGLVIVPPETPFRVWA